MDFKAPLPLSSIAEFNPDQTDILNATNKAMASLAAQRRSEVVVTAHLMRSKIAWAMTTYQQALLHRIVAVFDGVSLAWQGQSPLVAMMGARAQIESCAVFLHFVSSAERLLKAEDLPGLHALTTRALFASRDEDWLKLSPETEAAQILNRIDRLDRIVPGVRKHYAILSERCHPNSAGHHFMFARTDRTDGTVSFVPERDPTGNRVLILMGLFPCVLVEDASRKLDALILAVADLQHRLQPVPGQS